ncbi:MAG: PKD domain-containing protein, partial [Saprospiraceae bacterium]|nr:PKD domain-containing protein [Saprospiraceae bacterium]
MQFPDGSLVLSDNQEIEMEWNDTNASVSDSLGNLLFYTNGVYINNAIHATMFHGDSINDCCSYGYDLPQGALILPWPAKPNLYFLITGEDNYVSDPPWGWSCTKLYYSVIDMTQKNGLGAVVQKKTALMIDTLAYGKLAPVRHANGRDWWLAVSKKKTNKINVFLIDPTGIKLHHTQNIGIDQNESIGQAQFTRDGQKLVIFNKNTENGISYADLDLYNFDRCSGMFDNHEYFRIATPSLGGGAVISPNSRWLYIMANTQLLQYDLWASPVSSSQLLIDEYEEFLDPFNTKFHRGYLGPDNKIYIVTTSGSRTLHVIHDPDEYGTACNFEQHGIRLPCYNTRSLPHYPDYRLGPEDGSSCDTLGIDNNPEAWYRYTKDTLEALKVAFHDLSYHEPATWLWNFGDGHTSTERHPVHEYDSAGVYQVCLTVTNANGADTHCKTLYMGVSAQENPVLQSQIQVTPNPFTDRLMVSLSASLRSPVFRLYDQTGRLVLQERILFGVNEIDTENLPKGMYFWTVETTVGATVGAGFTPALIPNTQ